MVENKCTVSTDRINLVKRVQKQNFADKNSILIDDYNKNISDFKRRGGMESIIPLHQILLENLKN